MPRRREPPRLYLRADEDVWVIRDGPTTVRTGCSGSNRSGAEKALSIYLSEKHEPVHSERSPARLSVARVLTVYGKEHAPSLHAADRAGYAIDALLPFWKDKTLADIRGGTCRAYSAYRSQDVQPGTIRRELAVLAAAIKYWHKEHGPLDAVPIVTRPERPESKHDWLTRSEAAALLAAALGWYRDDEGWHRDTSAMNAKLPHLARFILIGLYTGTRSGAIMGLRWMPNTTGGWVDFDRQILHRRGRNVGETKKRQPQMRVNPRLLAHMRRWQRMDDGGPQHIVSWNGKPIENIRRAWVEAVERAGLRHVSPHVLRHTRATWLMQAGVEMWEAAGSLGMTVQTLEQTYAHHHPDWQKSAAEV